MKKCIIILLTFSVLLLSGCNKAQKTETSAGNPQQEPNNQIQTEITKPEEKIKHEITEDWSSEGWSALKEISYDFDSDGEDDKLQVFSSKFINPGDEQLHTDGANWLITVTTAKGVYKLYEGYLHTGFPEINVGELYNEQPEKIVIFTHTSGTGKSVTHYTFSDGVFYEELVYRTDDFTLNGANIVESIEW